MTMRIGELVERFGGKLDGDGSVEVADVKGVEFAGPAEATFALDDKLLEKAEASPACCVIVRTDARASSKPLIRCSSPESYAADLLEFFHPAPQPTPGGGIGHDRPERDGRLQLPNRAAGPPDGLGGRG